VQWSSLKPTVQGPLVLLAQSAAKLAHALLVIRQRLAEWKYGASHL